MRIALTVKFAGKEWSWEAGKGTVELIRIAGTILSVGIDFTLAA